MSGTRKGVRGGDLCCIHTRPGDLLVLFFFSFPWGGYVVVSGDGGMSTANIPLVKMANINSRKNLGVFQCLMDPTGFHTDPMLRGPEARAQLFQPIREDLDMELELPGSQIRVAVAVTG